MNVVFRFSRKSLFVASLLVSSLFVGVFLNCSNGAFLENVVHVKNEAELKNAVDNASLKGTIIALDNDITLTESALTISYNKDITLTSNRPSGFYKLISGVANCAVIVVEGGVLKLDGIIVSGGSDSGIHVHDNGVLVMYDGEISDNTSYFYGGFNPFGYVGVGGGVCIDSGVFEMYSGKISNNRAQSYGGGVRMGLGGAVFSMFGGEISGNTAEYGGGVYSAGDGFSWFGGVISGNAAAIEGDDVYPTGSGGSSNGNGDGGSSNGNNGSDGNGGGSGSGGNDISSNGDGLSGSGGFGLRDVLFVCVGVTIVVVGVVVAILLFTFKKKVDQVELKLSNMSVDKV